MTSRAQSLAMAPMVFGVSRTEAAAAIGVSATLFDELVRERLMPEPRQVRTRLIWDVDELRAAFKVLPRRGGEVESVNTWADA